MVLTQHGINSLDSSGSIWDIPFKSGQPLVYNGKSYRTKRIGNLLMTTDFFDEDIYEYYTYNNIKYYLCRYRFDIEALVSNMGWRLATDADILYIKEIIEEIKEQTGYSYNQLLSTQNRWRSDYKGDNLTGLGLEPTGYFYYSSISSSKDQGWYAWSGAHATTGNGAVCFQRWGSENFNNESRNWNNGNRLPIVFVKDA